jgi:hypothetical protein
LSLSPLRCCCCCCFLFSGPPAVSYAPNLFFRPDRKTHESKETTKKYDGTIFRLGAGLLFSFSHVLTKALHGPDLLGQHCQHTARPPTNTNTMENHHCAPTYFFLQTTLRCLAIHSSFYSSLCLVALHREGEKKTQASSSSLRSALSLPNPTLRQKATSRIRTNPQEPSHLFIFTCSTHAHHQRLPFPRCSLMGKRRGSPPPLKDVLTSCPGWKEEEGSTCRRPCPCSCSRCCL